MNAVIAFFFSLIDLVLLCAFLLLLTVHMVLSRDDKLLLHA